MSEALIAFLNARLDEDEAAARTAASAAGPAWQFGRDFPTSYLRSDSGAILADTLLADEGQIGPHIARHDPARVLREVEAKRRLITFALKNAESIDGEWGDCHDAGEIASGQCKDHGMRAAMRALRPLCAIYSDHPDYRDEWKP